MEKVRPWCGQPSDRGRLRNRTEQILYNGRPYPPNLPIPTSDLDFHLIYNSLGPSKLKTQTAFFAQLTAECPILYRGPPLPLKIVPSHGDLDPLSYMVPLAQVLNSKSNNILIGSAVLQGSLLRQADRPRYLVGNNRPIF